MFDIFGQGDWMSFEQVISLEVAHSRSHFEL